MAGGRNSTRSSVARGTPTSPPKKPATRRTNRSTRSQSADVGDSDNGVSSRRVATKRASYQPSIGSIDSDDGASERPRRATQSAIARKMSTVAEDQEVANDEDSEDEDMMDDPEEVERASSIGGESHGSGITATTSTSFGVGLYQDLEPNAIIGSLPKLLKFSHGILNLFPMDTVETSAAELKLPGTTLASLMRTAESKFNEVRKTYGPGDFINTDGILRKLLGTLDLGVGDFRPDAVLETANLAMFAKGIMTSQRESRGTHHFLEGIDTFFPKQFLTSFGENTAYGQSLLRDDTFELALELRTQWVISYLRWMKTYEPARMDVDYPYKALHNAFLIDSPRDAIPHFIYEDGTASLKTMAGVLNDEVGAAKLQDQAAMIRERINQIEESFYEEEVSGDDFYDSDKLEKDFPWLQVQRLVIVWCQARLQEIDGSIEQQGEVGTIVQSLTSVVQKSKDQAHDLDGVREEQQRQLLPAPDIIPAGSGRSLYSGKKSVLVLKKVKASGQTPSTASASRIATTSSNGVQQSFRSTTTIESGKGEVRDNVAQPDDFNPAIDDDADLFVPEEHEKYLDIHKRLSKEKNKENIGTKAERPRKLIDRQPGAHKVQWDEDSQASKAKQASRKRAADDSDDGDDFQQDQTVPSSSRRRAAPNAQPRDIVRESQSPRKRVKGFQSPDNSSSEEQAEDNSGIGSSRIQGQRQGESHASDDEEPRPDPSQAAEVARHRTFLASQVNRLPQRRVAWSQYDEEHLLDLIIAHGCSWSHIEKIAEFEYPRDQVALKDKARNMKVKFLKAGTPLPNNFTLVPLSKQMVATVRRVVPDYEE